MAGRNGNIRIWVISRLYLPNFSGAAIQAHQILRELVRQGFSVTVLTAAEGAAESLRGKQVKRDGINIKYLRAIRLREWESLIRIRVLYKIAGYLNGLLSAFSLGILTAWILWRKGHHGDIVHIYGVKTFSFLSIWVARLRGMSSAVHMTLLNSDDPEFIRKHWDKFSAILRLESFHRADVITGYSSAQTKSCLSAGFDPQKVVQIPGGVELSQFHPVSEEERLTIRQKLGLNPDSRFIVFVGDAIARKGLDVLINAFLRLLLQIEGVELLIVGPCHFGEPRYMLAFELKGNFCKLPIHWIGKIDNVYDYVRASDVFCLPTRREGFGMAIIEAMAAGLPVVVTRLEGVTTDIFQSDREGILIDGHNPEDYAKALLRLLQDPVTAKEMGDTARARAVSEFSLEHIVERYAHLYRELAGGQLALSSKRL